MPSGGTLQGGSSLWEIPRLWDGCTVVVLGGGPSLKNIVVNNPLLNQRVIVIHYAILAMPTASIWFSGDSRCYWELQKEIDSIQCLKISMNIRNSKWPSLEGQKDIRIVGCKKGKGISSLEDRSILYYNGSAGGAAIDLAAKLGASRIIMYGFDARTIPKDYNPPPYCSPHTKNKIVQGWKLERGIWQKILSGCKEKGIEIINCTPDTELPIIPTGKLEDYIYV